MKEQLHYYHKVKESEINGTKHKNNTVDHGIYNTAYNYSADDNILWDTLYCALTRTEHSYGIDK